MRILPFFKYKNRIRHKRLIKEFTNNHLNVTGVRYCKSQVFITFSKSSLEELFDAAFKIDNFLKVIRGGLVISFFDDESRGIYAVSVDFRSQFKMPADAEPTGNTISGFMEYVKLFRVGGEKRDEDGGIIMWDGIKEGYFYKK